MGGGAARLVAVLLVSRAQGEKGRFLQRTTRRLAAWLTASSTAVTAAILRSRVCCTVFTRLERVLVYLRCSVRRCCGVGWLKQNKHCARIWP